MQLKFNSNRQSAITEFLAVNGREIPLAVIRSPRARRYLLRMRADGLVRLIIPRGGSAGEARKFAERNSAWLERQIQYFASQPQRSREWFVGTEILFRGEPVKIATGNNDRSIRFATESLDIANSSADLRPAIERHLRALAIKELPPRVFEFAALHQLKVHRVSVRSQRSRWGSCSRRGTISLNWRLVQIPLFVRDYIILHELMHLRQMNHSWKFWREVEAVCPDHKIAKQWLKQHPGLLS